MGRASLMRSFACAATPGRLAAAGRSGSPPSACAPRGTGETDATPNGTSARPGNAGAPSRCAGTAGSAWCLIMGPGSSPRPPPTCAAGPVSRRGAGPGRTSPPGIPTGSGITFGTGADTTRASSPPCPVIGPPDDSATGAAIARGTRTGKGAYGGPCEGANATLSSVARRASPSIGSGAPRSADRRGRPTAAGFAGKASRATGR